MEYFIQISNFTLVINPQNGKNFMLDGIVNELSQSSVDSRAIDTILASSISSSLVSNLTCPISFK